MLSLLDLKVQLLLYLRQILKYILHLAQKAGRLRHLELFLILTHLRDGHIRSLTFQKMAVVFRVLHSATFLELLEQLTVLILDLDQLLDFSPRVG